MTGRWTRWAWAATAGVFVLGCQSSHPGYPNAPLLSSKQPVAGKPDASPRPVQVAEAEPKAPQLDSEALASLPVNSSPAASLGLPTGSVRPSDTGPTPPPSPFRTAGRTRGQLVATPAVRSSASSDAGPALGGNITGNFGHAEDYTWLQGTLEKHYRGRYYLRFCDHSSEDKLGGKVCLDRDPMLNQFKEGDVIRVEGSVDTEPDTRHEGWKHYPRYKLKAARLVEQKD